MEQFLKPFLEKIIELSTIGINSEIKGELGNINFFIIAAPVDTVARAPLQNMKQFNGYYGCGLCYHPGKILKPKTPAKFLAMKDNAERDILDTSYYPEVGKDLSCEIPVFGKSGS